MSYTTPKTDWTERDTFEVENRNAVEANIEYLAGNGGEQQLGKTDDVEFGSVDSAGPVSCSSLSTGQGSNKLYPMNQGVRTTDAVTFATVNTGAGANELYPMNQAVRTTDTPTFNGLYATYTGSTYSITNYPIGSVLLVNDTTGNTINSNISVYISSTLTFSTNSGGGSDPQLVGTWKSRGRVGTTILAQRTS